MKNNKLTLKSQPFFLSKKHKGFTGEVNKC